MSAAQKREILIVLPKRRGVEIKISCCSESHPFISRTFLWARSNDPGFSVLKNTRVAERRYSSWNILWWYERFQPQRSSAFKASRRRAIWKKPSRIVNPIASVDWSNDGSVTGAPDMTLSNLNLQAGMSVVAVSAVVLLCFHCTSYLRALGLNERISFKYDTAKYRRVVSFQLYVYQNDQTPYLSSVPKLRHVSTCSHKTPSGSSGPHKIPSGFSYAYVIFIRLRDFS